MIDRKTASGLGFGSAQAALNPLAASTFYVDTHAVGGGLYWFVKEITALLDTTTAAVLANGDALSVVLCPPSTPPPELGNTGGQAFVNARPLIIAEVDLAAAAAGVPVNDGDVINFASGRRLSRLSVTRDIIVPQFWNLRAIGNLSGNAGAITAATLFLNFLYVPQELC